MLFSWIVTVVVFGGWHNLSLVNIGDNVRILDIFDAGVKGEVLIFSVFDCNCDLSFVSDFRNKKSSESLL